MKYVKITNGGVLIAKESDSAPKDGDWRELVDVAIPEHNRETQEVVQSGWSVGETVSPVFVVLELNERKPESGEVFDRPVPVSTTPRYDPPFWADALCKRLAISKEEMNEIFTR